MPPAQTPRTTWPAATDRCAVALLLAFASGCAATLTGAYVMPRPGRQVTAPTAGDRPTVFVSATIGFSANVEVAAPGCSRSQLSATCKAWLRRTEMALAVALTQKLQGASQRWRFVPVAAGDASWGARTRPGDLHVEVGFEDLFDRKWHYGVLVMWRSDTYDTATRVRVSDAASGGELATFNVSDRAELGLNYVWFVDIFIPLFPLYWDDNTSGRANLLGRVFHQVSAQLLPVLTTASRAASVARSRARGESVEKPGSPAQGRGAASDGGDLARPLDREIRLLGGDGRRPDAASGGGDLDLRRWLELPNVRLVAVDFYADWCKPCRESRPRWQALHDRYWDRGLRVLVVYTQSRGTHATPGWSPDHVVADPYGVIARSWGVGDRLPQAFLWSWDGRVLASGAGVEGVERSVKRWFARAPGIAVAPPEGADGKPLPPKRGGPLKRAIRGELARLGKLDVVADEREREMLGKLRKQSHSVRREGSGRCKLGREISANMLLKVVVDPAADGGRPSLRLELFGIEQSCMLAWSSVPMGVGHRDAAAAEAVSKLLGGLKVAPQIPGT